jgi:hypothetical protein
MKISYSQFEKYSSCGKSYELHYIKKLRPDLTSSAFFFGTAVGQVWQALALTKKEVLTQQEKKDIELAKNPKESFNRLMKNIDLNGKIIPATDPRVQYYKGDYDGELLQKDDWEKIDAYAKELGQILDNNRLVAFEDLINLYPSGLSDNDVSYLNLHFYLSLIRKGEMMIDTFEKEVLPNIVKVYAIEKPIKIDLSLESDKALTDYLIGYLDMKIDYKITDAKLAAKLELQVDSVITVLFDNKTSSARYGSKCLQEKPQLNIYQFAENTKYIGYIVGIKDIKRPKIGVRKGECYAEIQVVIGLASEEISNTVLDGVNKMLDGISKKEFPENREVCKFIFGRPCCYKDYCESGNLSGLIQK